MIFIYTPGVVCRLQISFFYNSTKMSMSMGDMPAGSMSMGDGVPSLFTLQKMYWAVVGSAIGAATLVNVLDRVIASHRYG